MPRKFQPDDELPSKNTRRCPMARRHLHFYFRRSLHRDRHIESERHQLLFGKASTPVLGLV
jgi:hypothetical protein